jgi:N-acetylglucosaminyldiphosphoundecaprenol N-acetyl-beta-D-mannosaminyltransferase
LKVPVRAHLGATLNFQAGTVKRAPLFLQKIGLEWLWRIKEEPQLAKRYARDATMLLGLLITHVLMLALFKGWLRLTSHLAPRNFEVIYRETESLITISFLGEMVGSHVAEAIGHFRRALLTKKPFTVDLSQASMIDSRFLGALMMLRKCLKMEGKSLMLTCASPRMRRLLRLNGAEFLIS